MKFGYDTIIVGGGVIGVSIAYFLTKSGQRVAVLERNTLASGSSGKCDGDVQNVDSKPGLATAFSGASMAMFPGVVRDLDCDVKYEVSGSLFVFETDAEAQAGKKLVLEKRALGIELKQLDTYEAHQLEPNLAEDIVGGIHTMSDAQVDPMLLTFALAEKARQRGAEIFPFHEVSEIVRQQGGFVVKAAEDAFRAANVVIAAGVWSPFIGRLVGLDIPIKPRQGQLLVSENVSDVVRYPTTEFGYIMAKYAGSEYRRSVPEAVEKNGIAMLVEPRHGRNLLIGSSRRFAGYDVQNDYQVIREMARRTCRFFPVLRDINMIRSYAGLRPYTADQMPFLSRTGTEGLYVAAGREGAGITLSLATGKFMDDLICGKPVDFEENLFSLDRFAQSGQKDGR